MSPPSSGPPARHVALASRALAEALALHEALVAGGLAGELASAARRLAMILGAGGTVYWVGNGGSAADAQHLAAELVGRFERERGPLRSHALTVNSSTLTALCNDYPPERVFERQVQAFCGAGDALVVLSTSGNSDNACLAATAARARGCWVLALSGAGGRLGGLADQAIRVPSARTSRIQEAHILIGHALCELIDTILEEQG